MIKAPVSPLNADILPDFMAFDMVALDFPVAFAASPRVYAMGFPAVRISLWLTVYLLSVLLDRVLGRSGSMPGKLGWDIGGSPPPEGI